MIYTIHTDGGARGNPGPAAIGIIVVDTLGKKITRGKYIGVATNNVAEYSAVSEAFAVLLETIPREDRGDVRFFLDSLLVVNQLEGKYKVKDQHLGKLFLEIKRKEHEWGRRVFYQHIPRSQNSEADRLVNDALDKERAVK